MKIDVFTHFAPPAYRAALKKKVSKKPYLLSPLEVTPAINDMEARLRIMEPFDDYAQVLSLAGPPLDAVVSPEDGAQLATIVNDEMAQLQTRYPQHIVGAIATLPMHHMEAAVKEAERAVLDLGLKGVQIHSAVAGKPLDNEEFFPLYEMMSQFNLPIFLHPMRRRETPDYPGEDHSRFWIWQVLGWPYETAVAMTRLVFSGVFDRFPDLKFVVHHCGAMVPFFSQRIEGCYDYADVFFNTKYLRRLRKPLLDYFRLFYADTAIHGYTPGLMCGHDFFGPEHILFASDMPHDSQGGVKYIRDTIAGVDRMNIAASEKQMIFEGNARRLMRLTV